MPKDKIKNLFISHVHEDDAAVKGVKDLIDSKGYAIRDSSIVSEKPNQAKSANYIKSEILAPRIEWAGTMVVVISPETHTSKWVNWEIEQANRQGKRIVGVYARGGTEADVPEAFERYGSALVGWNTESIIDAVDGRKNDFQRPDGSPRAPAHAVSAVPMIFVE